MSKTSFIDNEPAFRWSLVQDPMANEKLTEGELESFPFQAFFVGGRTIEPVRDSMACLG